MNIINTNLLTVRNIIVIAIITAGWHVVMSPIFAKLSMKGDE